VSDAIAVVENVNVENVEIDKIIAAIADGDAREVMARALHAEAAAQRTLDDIRLEPYEEPDYEAQDLLMWEELATPVRSTLIALSELKEALAPLAPAESHANDEVDIAFDLIDPEPAVPVRDTMKEDVDQLVRTTLGDASPEDAMRAAVRPLSDLMMYETMRFGARLRNPTIIADRWNLLADMQEFKGKFKKLLAALRLALVHPYTTAEQRARLVDYHTELDAALQLRQAIALLLRDVLGLVEASGRASDVERAFIVQELFVRLIRFSRSAAFALVRAPDKRLMIEFRHDLATKLGVERLSSREVGDVLEGFVRYLEALGAISRREVLVNHDRALAQDLARALDAVDVRQPSVAVGAIAEIRAQAMALLGRDPVLDDVLATHPLLEDEADLALLIALLRRGFLRIR
jgi:hypothetical protein